MNKENLREMVKLVESTISKKLNESSVPPFSNKREAMLAIQDVMDGSMTQKNFINQLAAAKRAGTIDEKNFKLSLGQLRMDARNAGVKLEPIIDRLIDKYHSGSDVFNPNLGEGLNLNALKLNDIVRFKDGEEWIVVKPGIKYGKIFMKPFNSKAKAANISMAIEFTSDDLSTAVVVNESKKLTENYQEYGVIKPGNKYKSGKKLTEAPLAPVATPRPVAKPAAPAPVATPVAPVEQGVDPAWKLDMIDFIGNSFQGQAKQFLYQAKKSNPKATPEQITAMVNDLITSNQIVELFKTRFLSSIKAAL